MATKFHTEEGPHGEHGTMILSTPVGYVQLEMVQGPSFEVSVSRPDPHESHDTLNSDGEQQWRYLADQGWFDNEHGLCAMDLYDEEDDRPPDVAEVFKAAGLPPPWVCSFEDGTLVGPWQEAAATAS